MKHTPSASVRISKIDHQLLTALGQRTGRTPAGVVSRLIDVGGGALLPDGVLAPELPPELMAQVVALARQMGVSTSEAFGIIVRAGLPATRRYLKAEWF